MWDAFIKFITDILTWIYGVCGDWGLAIVILTICVRILIMPLMTKSARSMAKMQVLQPKMQEMQERYSDDPETLQKEMSKFYAENKYNPLGGCLPLLLQMPIFFAMFQVIRNIETISGGAASFYNIIPNLALGPAQVIEQSGWNAAIIYIVLDVLFGVLTLIPMLLNSQVGADPQQTKTSRIMGIVMAVWMVWIGWGLPSGCLVYYDTSALWQVIQQQLVTRRVQAKAKAEAEAVMANQPVQLNVSVVRKEQKKRPHKKS